MRTIYPHPKQTYTPFNAKGASVRYDMGGYFDYAATTPIDPQVLQAMLPYLKEEYGNPSSLYSLAQKSHDAVELSRNKIARFLSCAPEEIIFTGSATEANNLAIFGSVKKFKELNPKIKPHIITSQIEHHAILNPCRELENYGTEITYLPVSKDGLINPTDIKKYLKKNTVLISVMYANNEIGVIQPIREISRIVKSFNPKIIFHTDAVQALNYLDCNPAKLGVDLMTLSSHKIYGPKGIGALYIRKDTPIKPLITGGGQEFNLRSGTENVPGIVGFAEAINLLRKHKVDMKRIKKLRDKLIKGILKSVPHTKLNGTINERLPNNANFIFAKVEGESIVLFLDEKGVAASTGSACSAKDLKSSHVLLALGLRPEDAHGSLRLTMGRWTKESDVNYIIKILPPIIKKLREISPFKIHV